MLKVMTLVGTRPELIKMSRVIPALDANYNHIFVHSGQNYDYELNQVFFEEMEIRKPDYFLSVASETVAKTIAEILIKSDELFEKEKPDALLLYGDTNTCLAVIIAKRRKIPVFHMEAGNRCFDERVPEELNRRVIDHLSDINIVLTEHARRYLLREGIKPETIFKSGSHMKEVLNYYRGKIEKSDIVTRLNLKVNAYFMVSIHREENVDDPKNLELLLESMSLLVEKFQKDVIVSTHPRTRKRLETQPLFNKLSSKIHFLKPFGFIDYINLQKNSFCVLSDSGTITEESSILNFPAITVRNMHERPEGMDIGSVIMSGLHPSDILSSVEITVSNFNPERPNIVSDYDVDNVSLMIVKLIKSYTDYVNRVVWKKEKIGNRDDK